MQERSCQVDGKPRSSGAPRRPQPICANPLRAGEPDQRCSSHLGILFGKRVDGFAKSAEENIDGELHASPTTQAVVEALTRARANILEQIHLLDAKVRSIARQKAVVPRLMSVPGLGVITALGFAATTDDPTRSKRSSSAGAYLGLVPRIYASGETMRSGRVRVSKRGDDFLRRSLYEAANALLDTHSAIP